MAENKQAGSSPPVRRVTAPASGAPTRAVARQRLRYMDVAHLTATDTEQTYTCPFEFTWLDVGVAVGADGGVRWALAQMGEDQYVRAWQSGGDVDSFEGIVPPGTTLTYIRDSGSTDPTVAFTIIAMG